MGVPLSQMWTVAEYVVRQKLKRQTRYPLVLMLEPLLKCNLACAGCGKIQHPAEILRRTLSPSQCFDAIDQCGAPIVSIAGGEPLLHDQIDQIVAGFVQRKKYIYLCTNERDSAGKRASSVHALEIPLVFGPCRWASRRTRQGRMPRRSFRPSDQRDSCRRECRFSCHHKHNSV